VTTLTLEERPMPRPRRTRTLSALALLGMAGACLLPAGAASAEPVAVAADVLFEHLTTDTSDPTSIDVAPDGTVFWAERKGDVKTWKDGTQKLAASIPVAADSCPGCPDEVEEGGIHGLALAPDFASSRHLYAYHSVPFSVGRAPVPPKHPQAGGTASDEGLFRISRFTVRPDGTFDPAAGVSVFENPAEWRFCCHYAGDMDFLPDGTLVLSVGDDTNPFESSGYAPRDATPGRDVFNAERTSQNPADRRGKVLRIDVADVDGDGSTVPKDNPHVGDPAYDPYVYASGFRNPYRVAVDRATGSVIVGNVGPDAGSADAARGPEGLDEIEVIPPGGGTNHGWPRCIGPNRPYVDYDFATGRSGAPLSCEGMVPAGIYYPYAPTPQFPTLLTGTKTPMPGVVYDYEGDGERALPDSYRGDLLFLEWSRNAVYRIPTEGGVPDPAQILPLGLNVNAPMDAAVGPDGAVYVVEYGLGYYNTPNAAIGRLSCSVCQDLPVTAAGGALGKALGEAAAAVPVAGSGAGPAAALAVAALLLLGLPLRRRTV
jgi:aldose sugar dehydrogenase